MISPQAVNSGGSKRLVVARGADAGAELLVDDRVKIVGRARNAHLVLNDRSVSRHHFHVHATNTGVFVRACDGAAPIVHDHREISAGEVNVGSSIVVGHTVLLVSDFDGDDGLPPAGPDGATTNVRALLSGPAEDVRALAAVFALNEDLAAAGNGPAIQGVLAAWAKKHAVCETAEIVASDFVPDANADDGIIVETAAGDSGTKVFVPAHGTPSGWLVFTSALPHNRVANSLRRLLVLAAALCAARFAQLSLLLAVKEDRETFRQQAVGSARAFLGSSAAAERVVRLIPKLAASSATVLLSGETGVGKTFVARLIHESGARKEEPFRVINLASIPENLIESELFGHERGAFTGAVAAKPGAFEVAGRGTVLLDEIGELPLGSQSKLLHVLEDKRFVRLGSNRPVPLHARIIAATNRDLEAMVARGTFRRDLFFRISVVRTVVPPLRERGDDLVLLAEQILTDLAPSTGRRIDGFSHDAMEMIRGYPWPGNVRELRNAVEHAVVMGDGPRIEPSDLPHAVRALAKPATEGEEGPFLVRLPATLEWLEGRAIDAAMQATGGNRTKAAAMLGISRNTLYNKRREGTE